MIKTLRAFTGEIDDINTAVGDILFQLDLDKNIRKYSVGIISCFPDFISSGVISALAEKLPFPLTGATTLAGSSNGIIGEMILILTVLTSDDVEFVTGLTGPIAGEDEKPLIQAWEQAVAGRTDKPALMISFAPLLNNMSGDFFVEAWSSITGNVPNFGTAAIDNNKDYHDSQTIYGGSAYRDCYVFILCYGALEPLFFVGSISKKRVFWERGKVTASKGNLLSGVNGVSVAEYLKGLGLATDEDGKIAGINAFPFILDYNDGTRPVIRVMFSITPDGSAVCGGYVPEGATLMVGAINAEEVLATSEAAMKEALSSGKGRSWLMFSCAGRYFALGFNTTAEMEKAGALFGDTPFHLAYSGTEFCPVYGTDGSLTNRSHNDTVVICGI
ncbi:MAG: FIST C-terminal domain-containing protein [Spirochaetaceae bacterium]|jgi:hypothetical protein|nr:FIST C-terminal domain-containing protein [Spirochaetaceae bacterium]